MEPIHLSICNQKGGVGKSTLTIYAASWLHYRLRRNVMVVDSDYPQWSIHFQRQRELQLLDKSDFYKLMLLRQFRASQQKLWPVVQSTPAEAFEAAEEHIRTLDADPPCVLYDLPGTVGTTGVLSLLCRMDYLFVPLKADKMVIESSLHFARNLQAMIGSPGVRIRGVYLFWTMCDRREQTPLYERYGEVIEHLRLPLLDTRILYRAKFNKELLPDGKGIGRSTLLCAEPLFAREAGIEGLTEEIFARITPR